ncbi:MAG: hypothetical protein WBA93_11055 [Microcoleaceae cyanobacterium]
MDNNKIISIISQFKSLFRKVPSPETENEENELPTEIASSLKKAIKNLPCHPKYITTIQSTLKEALSEWQENPEGNELVILSNYVEPLSEIIQIALADWSYENVEQTKLLSWSNRPTDCLKIIPQLQKELELSANLNIDNNPGNFHELVVIPCLEFCFLRHIQGLDGIEFLRNRIFQDRSRFWLIGCNTLTWQYLDQIYKINSYFEKTLSLPNVEGAELQEWLAHVIDKLEFSSSKETTEKQTAKIQDYFDNLSNIAKGSSVVAAQLWLTSLTIANIENVNTEPETEQPILVKYNKPKLLDLPELTAEDRYLLFSMLLHKEINLSQLALSLGESESAIQFQIQKLLDQGVIQRCNNFLIVHPAHYPKLLKHLKKYNFITDLIE